MKARSQLLKDARPVVFEKKVFTVGVLHPTTEIKRIPFISISYVIRVF